MTPRPPRWPSGSGAEGADRPPPPPAPSDGPRPAAGADRGPDTPPAVSAQDAETGRDARPTARRLQDIYARLLEAIRRDDVEVTLRLVAEAQALVDGGRRTGPPPDLTEMAEVLRLVDEAGLVLAQRLADLREKRRRLRRGRCGLRGYGGASGTG